MSRALGHHRILEKDGAGAESMSIGLDVGAEQGLRRSPAALAWRREQWFFTGMAVAAALTVFVGYAPTYFLKRLYGAPPLSPLVHLHGILFTSWILLFLAQTTLVAARRTEAHRRLGLVGGLLAVAMVVVGLSVAIRFAHRGLTPLGGPPPLVFLVMPFGDMVLFPALVGAGLYFRRRPDTHKRLMLLATISLLTAAVARLPGVVGTGPLVFAPLTDVFVVACLVYDRLARGRVHPAFLWGGLFLIASQPLRLWIGSTEAWLDFATWLTR